MAKNTQKAVENSVCLSLSLCIDRQSANKLLVQTRQTKRAEKRDNLLIKPNQKNGSHLTVDGTAYCATTYHNDS